MSLKRSVMAGATLLVVALGASPAGAQKARPAWVIPETLRVREGPGSDEPVVGTVHRGDKLQVVAFRDRWCRVRLSEGGYGWVAEWLVQFSASEGHKLAAQAGSQPGGSSDSSGGGQTAWIGVGEANVREGPGEDCDRLGTRPKGTEVTILARGNGWCRVRTPGGTGWVRADLLAFSPPSGAAGSGSGGAAKAYVARPQVSLRSGPGTGYDRRALLLEGQAVYVAQVKGDWARVRVHAGNDGWVANWLLKYEDGSSPTSGSRRAGSAATGGRELDSLPAWVDSNGVRVRSGPGTDRGVVTQLDRGTKVTVTDISGHWCRVRLGGGRSGWVAGWCLNFRGPGAPIVAEEGGRNVPVYVGWVARPQVNLRAGPGTEHEVVGSAALSTQVVILDKQGPWYRVGLSGGRTAWAASWLIDTRGQRQERQARLASRSGSRRGGAVSAARAVIAAASRYGSKVVSTALRYLGSPYRHAHSGEGGAFDCSGFTSYVYRQFGVSLSRSCVAQYRQGTPVAKSELRAGDLVFFAGTYRGGISHVGIYIGGGQFVHAANSRSGVKVSSVNDSYYGPKFAGGRRMR